MGFSFRPGQDSTTTVVISTTTVAAITTRVVSPCDGQTPGVARRRHRAVGRARNARIDPSRRRRRRATAPWFYLQPLPHPRRAAQRGRGTVRRTGTGELGRALRSHVPHHPGG